MMIAALGFLLSGSFGLAPLQADHTAREPKALMIFIDGFIPAALQAAPAPAMQSLLPRAAYSLRARAESTTISGSGWVSFLTGVHWDKHQVPDNAFANPNPERYPHIFKRLRQARPDAVVASAQSWKPIEQYWVLPSRPDHTAFHDYYDFNQDYWDEKSCDALCADAMVEFLKQPGLDLAVIMFAESDGVGHSDGNRHYDAQDPLYQKMIAKIDAHIGRLLRTIEQRPSYEREDWLIVVSTDHGGSRQGGHGRNIPEHREIPLVLSGASMYAGEIWPPPKAVDIVPTVLHHLGVEVDPEWELDGQVVGIEASRPTRPSLNRNLIFHGDAEAERGFAHYSGYPDASILGWQDPSYLTVLRYGAGGGFPKSGDPLPVQAGQQFFAGGGVTSETHMTQTIALDALSSAIRSGVEYELSAWLGGYADQDDHALLEARFLNADGETIGRAQLEPVLAADRNDRTGFRHRTARGTLPSETTSVVVELRMKPVVGHNDGYADNLRFILRARD